MNSHAGKRSGGVTVRTLFRENKKALKLKVLSDESSFERIICVKDLHRPGLALAGFVDLFTFERVQICGNTEAAYLKKLDAERLTRILKRVFQFEIPCIIVTDENVLPKRCLELARAAGISLIGTPYATTQVIQHLGEYLEEQFAPEMYIHGSLVDIYGIGILVTGRSGIGKSEVALDLISRGHMLVADDVIRIIRKSPRSLVGMGSETIRHHMEIRGVGIIDIQAIYGIRGIRQKKQIDVMVELVDWDDSGKYERLGLKEEKGVLLGEKVPLVRLPIYPGKNISVILEVIALNQLLKAQGHYAARRLETRLNRMPIRKETENRIPGKGPGIDKDEKTDPSGSSLSCDGKGT